MKNILILLLTFYSVSIFSQGNSPNKASGIDSATLGNELLNWKSGSSTIRGHQNIKYNQVWGSYFSAGSGTARKQDGRWNVVIGENAGDSLNGGARNTFLNKDAGQSTTVGNDNFAVGWDALRDNKFGNANIAIVQDALRSNLRGSNNVALGRGAQFSNIAGNHNVSAGWQSLYYLENGSENVAIGGYAGAFLLKGSGNVYIGQYAGEHNDAAVGKTINDAIYIGRYTGLSSAHSNSINIGYNIQSTGDGKINIGNVYKGDVTTGNAEVTSISISGRQITFDDNFMYVKTSTGVVKRVPLQDVSTAREPVGFKVYNTQGQLLFYQPVYKN